MLVIFFRKIITTFPQGHTISLASFLSYFATFSHNVLILLFFTTILPN